jgi:RNA polymerase sigma-70 factor, ECF subfamily
VEVEAAADLVTRCRRSPPGDTRAFEQLVSYYQRRVFSIAYRLMGNRHDAEDQAQEAFLRIYRGISSLEDPATLTGWIARVTTNVCLDALAARERRPRTAPLSPPGADGHEEPRYADTRTPTPEEAALHREVRQCLERTLARMEPPARAVLLLRDVEDRPYHEIAETLRLGLSAVKMRIHRARLMFQQVLETVCPDVAPGRP